MSHPFDEFSKSLAEEAVPRRESLRRLGAVLAGALLTPLGVGTALARTRDWRSQRVQDPCQTFCKCRNSKQQSQCLKACQACSGNTGRIGGSCGSYVCCSTASCNGVCSDLRSDPNCGACGNNCGANGQTCCGKRCANLKTDASNCGACGRVCGGATPYCINGTCSACAPGQTKCGTACVDLNSDAANCGTCGNVCGGSTPFCTDGTCTQTYCNGADLNWDSANCGACGFVCPEQFACSFGVCEGINYDGN